MEAQAGEQIFYHGHPSWRSILGFYIKGLLLTLLAGVIVGVVTRLTGHTVNVGLVVAAVLVVFVLALIAGLLKRIATTYTITSQRLTIHRGILSRDLHEARLERVQNVAFRQSLLERILQVGTVTFDTAGEAGYDFSFRGVSDPGEIVSTVDQAIHDFQARQPGV